MLTTAKRPLHQTALRLVALWRWLSNESLTLEAIRQRYQTQLNCKLSDHSLRLYLTTLKRFGCGIYRDREPNGVSTYRIRSHEYLKKVLHQIDVELLEQLAELGGFTTQLHEQVTWLEFLNQLASWAGVEWNALFVNKPLLQPITDAIAQSHLLTVHYQLAATPLQRSILCLPVGAFIRRHRHYLRVLRTDKEGLSALRMDRIMAVNPADHPNVLQALRLKHRYQPLIEVHFSIPPSHSFPALPDIRDIKPLDEQTVAVFLETRDTFLLVQQLLSSGLPFQIQNPPKFRQHIQQIFSLMEAHHYG